MRSWQNLQHQFWRSLSRQGLAWFLLAIAATFGSMGFLLDLANLEAPFSNALYGAVFCGLVAIAWFVAITHNLRLLPIVIVIHIAGTWFLSKPARHSPFAAFAGITLEQR